MFTRRSFGFLAGSLSICLLPFVAPVHGMAPAEPPPIQQGPNTHEMKLTVSTTGSPFDNANWAGGPASIGVTFRYFNPDLYQYQSCSVWVEFVKGKTPCDYAKELAEAIDEHTTLQTFGFETEIVNNTVFVTGPECEHCSGSIESPEVYGNANRIQVIQSVKEL